MPRTRPPEFRIEAVRILRSGARSPRQLAAELGCSEQTLHNWLRQDQADRGERADVLTTEERARLRELQSKPTDHRQREDDPPVLRWLVKSPRRRSATDQMNA